MICSKCGEDKPPSEFSKCKRNLSGFRGQCRSCRVTYSSEYYKKNKEKCIARKRVYYQENKDKVKSKRMEYHYNNPEKNTAQSGKYRARKFNASPKWLTQDDYDLIQWIYDTAKERTDTYGVKFHVDHIIPLQGKNVCGLHVPSNLQVITAKENFSKSNKYEVTFCLIG